MIGLLPPSGPLAVTCLGAHPDDIEIGCGGTLLMLARRGDVDVRALVLTGTSERAAETERALSDFCPGTSVRVAGLRDGHLPTLWGEVKQALEDFRGPADIVLAPRLDDRHQDHRLVGSLSSTVWRDSMILHYEIPKWDGDTATPTHYVPVSDAAARHKVDLLNQHFPSQAARDWWDDELFLGLMRVRGMECRNRYAEGFFATKVLLDLSEGRVHA